MYIEDALENITKVAEGNYRKMLVVLETCYSGFIGTYCEGLPGVLMLCATHTTASHAGLYNDSCYGNVYRNTMEEFMIPRIPVL